FTHEGDLCSFEVLCARLGLSDPALRALSEIVHDIDLKDGKFARQEAAGIGCLLAGIAMAHGDDEGRLERGRAVFDELYEYFRRTHARLGRPSCGTARASGSPPASTGPTRNTGAIAGSPAASISRGRSMRLRGSTPLVTYTPRACGSISSTSGTCWFAARSSC